MFNETAFEALSAKYLKVLDQIVLMLNAYRSWVVQKPRDEMDRKIMSFKNAYEMFLKCEREVDYIMRQWDSLIRGISEVRHGSLPVPVPVRSKQGRRNKGGGQPGHTPPLQKVLIYTPTFSATFPGGPWVGPKPIRSGSHSLMVPHLSNYSSATGSKR